MNLNLIYYFAKNKLEGESSGHDWLHALRVERNAINISPQGLTQSEQNIIKICCWLHDTIDPKLSDSKKTTISDIRKLLKKAEVNKNTIQEIIYIIQNLSYSKNIEKKKELSLVGKIVQDADRLDAIGAIGIARAFYYGGNKEHVLYNNKEARHINEMTEVNYRDQDSVINHFYEKLLLLKDSMNTKNAKIIANQRTEFMESFLKQFYEETQYKK